MPPRDADSTESPLLPTHTRKSNMDHPNKKQSRKSARRQSRYLADFHELSSNNPILSSLFKNEEQITSSFGVLDTASIHASSNADSQTSFSTFTLCLVLGDGRTPRTGIAAAIQYGWSVVAIDEKLDEKWIKPRALPRECRFMGFKGNMSNFFSEGLDLVQLNLCAITTIQELVIVCMEKDGGYSTLKCVKGRSGISNLRAMFNNAPTTIVSISSEENTKENPFKSKPNEVIVDEDILSNNRLVQVWTFVGSSRRHSDAKPKSKRKSKRQST